MANPNKPIQNSYVIARTIGQLKEILADFPDDMRLLERTEVSLYTTRLQETTCALTPTYEDDGEEEFLDDEEDADPYVF